MRSPEQDSLQERFNAFKANVIQPVIQKVLLELKNRFSTNAHQSVYKALSGMDIMKLQLDTFLNADELISFCKHFSFFFPGLLSDAETFEIELREEIGIVKNLKCVQQLHDNTSKAVNEEEARVRLKKAEQIKRAQTAAAAPLTKKEMKERKKEEKKNLEAFNALVSSKLYKFYQCVRGCKLLKGKLALIIKIALALPVTSASCERSFSVLKLLKTYLRNTIGMQRVSNMAVLSIHSTMAKQLSRDAIINEFAASGNRKSNFGALPAPNCQ